MDGSFDGWAVHPRSATLSGIEHRALKTECVVRNQDEGSTWASVIAAVVVVGTIGVIYLPLVLR